MSINLADKAVLASLSISRWTGHVYDKRATNEVHQSNHSEADAGNYNKRLLPKGSTRKIDSVVNAARDFNRDHTMPWFDGGVRILPAQNYTKYAKCMKEFRQEYEDEVKVFLKLYPALVAASEKRLGKLYKPTDYPAVNEMRDSFGWDLTIMPFPDAADFRVAAHLGSEYENVRDDMQARMEKVYCDAMRDLGTRVVEVVCKMKDRLKAFKPGLPGQRAEGTFKDSLVDNVRELVAILPSFNLSGDPKLTKIIEVMQKDLCKYDADILRNDANLRKKIVMSADQVLTAVSDFIA